MKDKTIGTLAVMILASVVSCHCGAAERIVFVGDSITGQSRNHSEGFARQMDAAYAATIADAAALSSSATSSSPRAW